jgi:hypothetical protein
VKKVNLCLERTRSSRAMTGHMQSPGRTRSLGCLVPATFRTNGSDMHASKPVEKQIGVVVPAAPQPTCVTQRQFCSRQLQRSHLPVAV